MRISIDINPARPDQEEIGATIALLSALAAGEITAGSARVPALPATLHPDDNPDAGMAYPSASQAFSEASTVLADGPSASAAFGGNVAPPPAPQPPTNTGATSTPGGIELDKNGLPWDGRIHAETKTKNKDETWRNKRGVAPEVVARVEAELRQVMAAGGSAGNAPAPAWPFQAPSVPPMPAPPAPPVPAPNAFPSAGAGLATPPIPTAPGCAAPAGPSPATFVELVGKYAPLLQTGKLTQDEVRAACQAYGVPDLPLLNNRPDLVPSVAAYLDSILAMKG